MANLRSALNHLKREAREGLESFVLRDGTRHFFDPTSPDIFLHAVACLGAQSDGRDFPEPPATIKAIAQARNREAALNHVLGGASFGLFPYEYEALVECGKLVPRSLVVGHALGEGPLPDLSE